MKFGQLIKYNKRHHIFFKNHAEKEAGGLVPDLFLFFKKSLKEGKVGDPHLSFNIFRSPSTWYTIKELNKT